MKKDLNPNIKISEGNSTDLKGTNDVTFLIFSLPAKTTCPYATEICKRICYAKDAQEIFKYVRNARLKNFEETKKDTFVEDMIKHIDYQLNRKKNQNKKIYFRIHDSGDFWSQEYFDKWVQISNRYIEDNRIRFQAYTKSLPYLRKYDIKDINIQLVYSIMNDTKNENIKEAKEKGMIMFQAKPLSEIKKTDFVCTRKCGECKVCYDISGVKEIYAIYHGARISKSDKLESKHMKYFKN